MNSDFAELLQAFENYEVEYLVVGGYAVMAYAEPRFTKDFDVWVNTEGENPLKVYRALADFGAPLAGIEPDDFGKEGVVFQMGVSPVRVDVIMSIDGVNFSDAWSNRNRISFGELDGWVISKPDLITNKKASGRPQDLLDATALEDTD